MSPFNIEGVSNGGRSINIDYCDERSMNYLLSTKFVLDFAAQGKVERPRERCKNGISNLELLARFVEESGGPLANIYIIRASMVAETYL